MSGIKGWPSQKKITIDKITHQEYVTVLPTGSDRHSLDAVTRSVFRLGTVKATEAGSTDLIIVATAHAALPGDLIRIESGTYQYYEIPIINVTTDAIYLGTKLPTALGAGINYFIMRYTTPRLETDSTAIVSVTSGPISYKLDSITTEVNKTTGTPANSRPLPTEILVAGVPISPATETTQGAVNETAPASDTASSGLNGRLQRIAQRLTSLIGLFPATIGQKADAASLAVSLSTEGTAQIGSLTETAPASDTASSGLNGRLQRIAQRITALIALIPASLGQKTMAGSFAVTIASDQAAVPVTSAVADVTASGNITTQNLVPAGTATANSAVASGSLNGAGTCSVQVTGTYTGALSLQYTVDGTNWITVGGIPFKNVNTGVMSATIPSATPGIYQIEAAGLPQYRITGLGAMTGTAVVTLRSTRSSSVMSLDASLPTGANIIGALTANQSVNVGQINAVTPLMGAGPTGTGAQRVTTGNVAAATLANVASSASNVTLLASGAARMGATFYNDSTSSLYFKMGATASATSFTVLIPPAGYYELPQPCYSGIIDGIWSSANGNCRVTSW